MVNIVSNRYSEGDFPMSTLRNISLQFEIGQEILVGKNDERAKITKIEFFEKSGEIRINTTRGPRNVLTFKLLQEQVA